MTPTVPDNLTGRYLLAESSASRDARLHYEDGSLVVTLLESGEQHQVEFVELGDRIGKVPRKIYFKDGSVFECPDNDAVDLAFGQGNHFASRLSRAERSWKIVIVAVVLTVISLVGIYRYGIPLLANVAAHNTPTAVVDAIDAGTRDAVDRLLFSESKLDDERKAELTALFDEVAIASGHTEPPLTLLYRDGGALGANAIALPGGTIILTDQLEKLVANDDEIAGLFAHEIGHVNERHSLRQLYRVLGLTFMISLIGGDSGQVVEEVLSQAVLLETFSYTREFETSADAYSVKVMLKLERDPAAFLVLLDRLLEEHGLDTERETN